MHRCIYCLAGFDDAPKEHIIQAFLGARWKDGTLICQVCQTLFGKGIDQTLASKLQPFRLLLGVEGDRGGTGRPLKNLPVTSGEVINLGAHGKPEIARPHIKITEDGDRHQVQVKLGRKEDLGWALNEVRKQLPHAKLDSEQLKQRMVVKRERLDGEVELGLTLGGSDFFQAVLKCCVNLFAAHDPAGRAALLLDPAFDGVRAFVRAGTGQMGDYARWITSRLPLNLPQRGPADQTIMLTTRGSSVEGVMRFFGHLSFAVRLTNTYAGPPIAYAYLVDPYREADPAEQRLSGDQLAQFDQYIPVFAEQAPGNTPDVQAAWDAAIGRFMMHYAERDNQLLARQAVDHTIRQIPQAAALRAEIEAVVRKRIRERVVHFEQTGDARKITVIQTQGGGAALDQAGG